MSHEQIDGSRTIADIDAKSKSQDNVDDDAEESMTCAQCMSRTCLFSMTSVTMFTWNTIAFKLHGFCVLMIIIDMVWSMAKHPTNFISWFGATLLRNLVLLSTILLCCVIRIKLFGVKQEPELSESDEEKSERDDIIGGDTKDAANGDCMLFKAATITYLGVLCELKQIVERESKQLMYFLFPALFHAILGLTCAIIGTTVSGDSDNELSAKGMWFWLAWSMLFCFVMALLPVPGFDGAALLTIFLKRHAWNKVAIAFVLVMLSAIITVCCGVIGVLRIDRVAIYLALFCGIQLVRYVFNPKDENMKILKTMAKTTKTMSELQDGGSNV